MESHYHTGFKCYQVQSTAAKNKAFWTIFSASKSLKLVGVCKTSTGINDFGR